MADFTYPNGMTPNGESSQFIRRKPVQPAPPPPSKQPLHFSTNFASLSLHVYDRIRLLSFPSDLNDIARGTIAQFWPPGIQEERVFAGAYEFKLRGNPWLGSGDDAMHARRLVQQLFARFWNTGWLLTLSTDVSKKQTDKDTLIFRQQVPPPQPCDWMSISFSKHDRIRLMNAPVELKDAVIDALRPLIQDSEQYASIGDTWEIKVRGYPWMATGEDTMVARWLLLQLIAQLERFGFTVYASINQKANRQDHRSETDTWHCRRSQEWTYGSPVYHN